MANVARGVYSIFDIGDWGLGSLFETKTWQKVSFKASHIIDGASAPYIPAVNNIAFKLTTNKGFSLSLEPDNEGLVTFNDELPESGHEYSIEVVSNTKTVEKVNLVWNEMAGKSDIPQVKLNYAYEPLDVSIMAPLAKDALPMLDYFVRFAEGLFKGITSIVWDLAKKISSSLFHFTRETLDIAGSIIQFARNTFSIADENEVTSLDVQKLFDEIEKTEDGLKYPPIKHTKENLVRLLMNSVASVKPKVNDDGTIIWECNWDKYDQDKKDSLANITVVANKREKAPPELDHITIQFGKEPPQTIRMDGTAAYFHPVKGKANMDPAETEKWAIAYALSMFTARGESSEHLAAHLIVGIFEQTFAKTIGRNNPLLKFLIEHFTNTRAINKLGSLGIIFGDGSILELGGLSTKGLKDLIIDDMGADNWSTYKPREPLVDKEHRSDHYRAWGEKECYEDLLKGIGELLDNKEFWEEMTKPNNWKQLWRWSKLTHHQFPSIPEFIEGENAPAPNDKENLKKVLAYIFIKIFIHDIVHRGQEALTNIETAWLSPMERGLTEDLKMAKDGNSPVRVTARQLFVSRFLLEFEGHKMLDPKFKIHPKVHSIFNTFLSRMESYYKTAKNMMISIEI